MDTAQSTALRLIPAIPLAVALLHAIAIGLLRRPMPPRWVAYSAIGGTGGAIVFMLLALAELLGADSPLLVDRLGSWMGLGVGTLHFNVDVAFRFDALTAVICLGITGIALITKVYAIGFLADDAREDRGFERFFCFVELLLAFMLVLVLADNLALLLVGWSGVGIATYLLILFWYGESEHVRGGAQAIAVNLIGDAALILGALLLFWSLAEGGAPTLAFRSIEASLPIIERATIALPAFFGGGTWPLASAVGLCFFVAAAAKSAQLPFCAWLPDAGHAPIPALALVQSITTVAAGAYLIARFSFLYAVAPEASVVITWVGLLTAVFAAAAACAQTDLRRTLAWSTASQLGIVYAALGVGAPAFAMYHLIGHAYAKTLLFLACGVVVLALGNEFDMREMRGIGSRVRLTRRCWWVGALSLIGAPPFVGFFTTTLVLGAIAQAEHIAGHSLLQGFAFASLALTAFYGIRLVYLPLYGPTKLSAEVRGEVHDPDRTLLWPLIFLVLLCTFGSLAGWPQLWGDFVQIPDSNSIHYFLQPTLTTAAGVVTDTDLEAHVARLAMAMLLLGGVPAALLYLLAGDRLEDWTGRAPRLREWMHQGFYLDRAGRDGVANAVFGFARRFVDAFIERGVVERGFVGAVSGTVRGLAEGVLKFAQPGIVSASILLASLGVLGLALFFLTSAST